MRYLVVSEDALIPGRIKTSEYFPCVVNMAGFAFPHSAEDIMQECFISTTGEAFRPRDGKKYIIVPIHGDARKVTFNKLQPKFDYYVERWFG